MEFSYQQKRSIAYLTSTIIGILAYTTYVFGYNMDRAIDPEIHLRFYGISIVLIMPVLIVVNIVVHIIFTIIHKVQTNEMGEQFADELDKQIELKANNNAYAVFILGYLISAVTLIFELPLFWMINMQVASMFAASAVWSSSTLYFYRKGF